MNTNEHFSIANPIYLKIYKNFSFILVFLAGLMVSSIEQVQSDEIFLRCTGKYEVNRGRLIKPDWETSYLKINLDGLKSIVDDKGIKKEGRTLIRRNSYTITHRDNSNKIKTKYKIHAIHGTYVVNYPQTSRTLIGTCQKGRG